MDKRQVNLNIDYNSLCEFFSGMNHEEVYEIQLEIPYKMMDKMIDLVDRVSSEFDYMLNDVDVSVNETKFRFYSTAEVKEMEIDLMKDPEIKQEIKPEIKQEHYSRNEIDYINTDVDITYNGICEFFNDLYLEEFEGIEIEVPYIITIGEAEIILNVAIEYNYEIVDMWNEKSNTYIILEYFGEGFGEDLSIGSVTTGFGEERHGN